MELFVSETLEGFVCTGFCGGLGPVLDGALVLHKTGNKEDKFLNTYLTTKVWGSC